MRRIGRPLPINVYCLIEYIECTLPPEKSLGKQLATKKSLHDTKLLPKLVFCMENLYKFVMLLGHKTKNDLAKHLHVGSVRDFKINSLGLREALNQSITESLRTEVDETRLDELEVADLDEVAVVEPLPEKEGSSSMSSTGVLMSKVTKTDGKQSGKRVALSNLKNASSTRKQ